MIDCKITVLAQGAAAMSAFKHFSSSKLPNFFHDLGLHECNKRAKWSSAFSSRYIQINFCDKITSQTHVHLLEAYLTKNLSEKFILYGPMEVMETTQMGKAQETLCCERMEEKKDKNWSVIKFMFADL